MSEIMSEMRTATDPGTNSWRFKVSANDQPASIAML
jgi:hypothetical protein